MGKKVLAVVKSIHIGNRDIGRPCMWFSTYVRDGLAATQCLVGQKMLDAIEASGVEDIKTLEGSSCWVELEEGCDEPAASSIMKFAGFFRP